jgi:hypothetical protein
MFPAAEIGSSIARWTVRILLLRGAFEVRNNTSISDLVGLSFGAITDGTSNTILLSEALVGAVSGQDRLVKGGLGMFVGCLSATR